MSGLSDRPSPRSGRTPPKAHRFGQPDANPRGDQHTAAVAHAARNRAIDVLARAINADGVEFERILDAPSTPYVVRKLMEAFHGDGPLSSQGVRALLAMWQQVFDTTSDHSGSGGGEVINADMDFGDADTVLIRTIRYRDDHGRRMPGYMIDPRDGSAHALFTDPDGNSGSVDYMPIESPEQAGE